MSLQELDLASMLAQIGRTSPVISGSTTALIAAQLGTAMTRMALAVSNKHGSDTDMVIERLDSISAKVKDATENDRSASAALLHAYRPNSDATARRAALVDATRAPIAAALLLLELLELLEESTNQITDAAASDFHGGVELIGAAFSAVMMAVESNLRDDDAADLRGRTSCNRSTLRIRFDLAMSELRRARSS
ncbi:cyclodeaminase/cyclohydrolase family protein [Rhizobium sp. XQZ8]|uniref:cyclodeaminase/cyclohydrolase family protein n=1 Tax=Rhizobium populisoli TaxID=2859785 RepID=UPI001CA5BDD9|nr:cyclodeaminase/cyclohydrolase family protein [Rhizobium populisoli]MBW6425419.1 cyclodeaminase/cyclohydrolase family protein [Rhizobium populisoli]